MSKTIITSAGDNLDANFDQRFGRAEYFCLLDENSGATSFIKNENLNANQGAGTKAAEKIIELKAEKIISGDFGPKAKDLLDKFNIQMVILDESDITINAIIDKMKK